jgi:hypothetical protein
MRKDNSIKKRIGEVTSVVKAIESLRSRLFVKLLPPLFKDNCAKTIYGNPIWVVITEDQEYLKQVESVLLDNVDTDPGRHIKFFDANKNELLPVPLDIIALVTMSDAIAKKDIPKSLDYDQ